MPHHTLTAERELSDASNGDEGGSNTILAVYNARRDVLLTLRVLARVRLLYKIDFETTVILLSCLAINFSSRHFASVVPASASALSTVAQCSVDAATAAAEELCRLAIFERTSYGYLVSRPELVIG